MFGPKWKKYLSITEREKAERKRKSKQQLLKEKVVSFMEREDNSTVMPGKKDCSAGKIKIQKRVSNDYLHNLLRTILFPLWSEHSLSCSLASILPDNFC
jgi:hypothetical protein